MTWIVETPWPVLLMGALAAAILIGGWLQTGRASLLVALAPLLLVVGALLLLELVVVTDREAVEQTLYDLADDVERGDVEATMEHFHPDQLSVRRRIRGEMRRYDLENVAIHRNLEVELTEDAQPPQAVARFNGSADVSGGGGVFHEQRFVLFFTLTFVRQGDQWLLVDVQYEHPTQSVRKR